MTTNIWDEPDLQSGGDFIKFNEAGDTASGVITSIRVHRWDDGKVDPQIFLTTDDGEERTLTAGQVRLKAALTEARPNVGDHLKITLTQIEKRSGGKTLKHFDVAVTPAGQTPAAVSTPAAEPAAVETAAADPAALAAALGNLTAEQRKALGLS